MASKNVDASKPLEITLNFSEKETLDQMNFDLFVSKNNGIGAFEIQALSDGTYRTVYEGTKMGNIDDKVGDIDGGSGGYHAYYFAEFPETTTESVKVILKPGFLGEPSLYEIAPRLHRRTGRRRRRYVRIRKMIRRQKKPTELPTIM